MKAASENEGAFMGDTPWSSGLTLIVRRILVIIVADVS